MRIAAERKKKTANATLAVLWHEALSRQPNQRYPVRMLPNCRYPKITFRAQKNGNAFR
ncbi:MAG: hypothetical protein BWY39_01833 [Spirochaetes bacterium ADurb.Bin269]|nr:MAG: hypothetical protein BWY39_01833 [Spirochaetes bacterium ADurb.Bin269]